MVMWFGGWVSNRKKNISVERRGSEVKGQGCDLALHMGSNTFLVHLLSQKHAILTQSGEWTSYMNRSSDKSERSKQEVMTFDPKITEIQ